MLVSQSPGSMIGERLHLLDCATVTDPAFLQHFRIYHLTQHHNISPREPLQNYKEPRTERCLKTAISPTSLLLLITQETITILPILSTPKTTTLAS